ncbi:MAG TPA: sigma-70 family RNA polymerase sigma factor [Tenuifilaceae bacterium]|nr:sigma-70 family RNA polymerase sigma factor [Tenuifilaceae bacterium]HPI45434.1 sigma-70 family RNA polymerase sigma factor [Tenuifilaceae bacterium]HPN20489.1 sigma-70 family RNA polymerase sigma factor [Tenuifilaceae bacterium]HPV56263.1 sigma-70 family RNA polymerase sigma factor [Tenuifilaceae bacterium]
MNKDKEDISAFSDLQLIDLYKKVGDKQIVGEVYKRYTRFVFSICMKYLKDEDDSKDAVMQIFEKLFVDLLKHEVSNFKSWLHSVTRNHCLHIIRDSKYQNQKMKDFSNFEEEVMENQLFLYQDSVNVLEERVAELERELGNLSKEQRVCVELFYLKDKCYQEVAEITGYSLNQVKSYIQNGKRNLIISLVGNAGKQ